MKANSSAKDAGQSKAVAHSVSQAKSTDGSFDDRRPEALEAQSISKGIAQTQPKPNNTGMPDHLKSGIENLSGYSMDDVKVHYNSSKPANLQAHAYAQGTDIHLGPGQDKHLPHEAWHVAQQKQGRVQPTTQVNGAAVNDDVGLENEADVMGSKALQMRSKKAKAFEAPTLIKTSNAIQRLVIGLADAKEMEGESSTIANSTFTMKENSLVKGKKPDDKTVRLSEDTIAQIPKLGSIGLNEALILVAHGSEPKSTLFSEIQPVFAGQSASTVAKIIAKILPFGYKGTIYLNACYTGMRRKYSVKGTSFIELFGKALSDIRDDISGIIIGNLGPAQTISEDTEKNYISKELYDRLNKKEYPNLGYEDGKYYIIGLAGQAFFGANKYSAPALKFIGL